MALSSKLFPAVLLLLLVATEMGPVQEVTAAVCQDRCLGQRCSGFCVYDDECSIACRNENKGYDSGECRGAHHRCICYKKC